MAELAVPILALPVFSIVAYLYSSVGHGGASGYLALFALLGIAVPEIVPTALTLNIMVASIGLYQYGKQGHFDLQMLIPFSIASIPAAFIGGVIEVPREVFYMILGAALLFSAWRLLLYRQRDSELRSLPRRLLWVYGLPIGAGLGLLAGMIGIGGGVFLSPLLLLLRWADAKKTAATSAAFIVLNSVSGLTGQLLHTRFNPLLIVPLIVAVAAGGYVGARMGAIHLQPRTIRFVLGVVLVMAGTKLVLKVFLPF
ncbi:MAG: hypothetical protein CL946_08595 [Ectothiorhodospiraceae bacterium]|nr:hypothetical protein [Ectothiorhodospiraceae bacterium]